MRGLELKVPPLVVLLLSAILMWAIDQWVPLVDRSPFRTALAVAISAIALGTTVIAILGFHEARTTVDPRKPNSASAIVTTGIYRRSRNPMYLAFLLMLVGWAVYLGNIVSALMPVVFVLYMNRFQITPEERALHTRFGESYVAYLRSVRRWI